MTIWEPAPPAQPPHIVKVMKLPPDVFPGHMPAGPLVGTLLSDGQVIRPADGSVVSLGSPMVYIVWLSDGSIARATPAVLDSALRNLNQLPLERR